MQDYQRDGQATSGGSGSGGGAAPGKRTLTGGLPPRLAARAGAQLGQDFSSVTVHEDGAAEGLGTQAFARGDALHFASGAYRPDTASGAAMVGHELAHVAQQRSGRVVAEEVRGGVPVNTNAALEHEADSAGSAVAQGFDLDEFSAFGVSRARGPGVGIAQGADLTSSAAAPAPVGATTVPGAAPAAGGAVPPEVLARVGAQFRHTDDISAARSYQILAGGGFELIATTKGTIGSRFLPTDTGAKHTAWDTLSRYVVAHAAEIPPTVAPAQPPATGEPTTGAPADDPWTFGGLLTGAVDAVTGTVQGVIDAGKAFFGDISAIIDAALGLAPADGAAPAPGDPTVTPGDPAVTPSDPNAPLPTLGAVPGSPEVPAGDALTPTTTALTSSVGEGGTNGRDDVILVQSRLRALGYPVNATGTVDEATIRSIKLFQAARTAFAVAPGQKGSLVSWIDGRIDQGGASEKALLSGDARRFTTIAPSGVKRLGDSPQAAAAAATGDARAIWDRVLAIWNQVSPYLVGDAYMSSGYRSDADQTRIIEDFYTRTLEAGGYKETIVAAHGEADWASYVGLSDAASVAIKLERVRACGQAVSAPGESPHQSGRAIDVGGSQEADQIHALLRFAIEIDASVVTKILYEKNTCIHFEFTP